MSNTGYDTLPRTIEAMRGLTASQRFRYMNEINALPTFEDKKSYGAATPDEQSQRLLESLLAFDQQRNQGRNGSTGQVPPGGAQVIPFPGQQPQMMGQQPQQPQQQPQQPQMMGMPQQPPYQQQPQQPQFQAPPQQFQMPQPQQPQQQWQPPHQPQMGPPSPQSQVAPPGVSPTGMPPSMPGMPPGMAPVQLPPPVPVGMPAPGMPPMGAMPGMPGMPQPQMAPTQVAPPGPPPMGPGNGMPQQLPLPMMAPPQAADARDPEPPAKGKGRGKGKAAAAPAGSDGAPMAVLGTILETCNKTLDALGTHTMAMGRTREAVEQQNALLRLTLAVVIDLYLGVSQQPMDSIAQRSIGHLQSGAVDQLLQMVGQALGDPGKG